MGGSVKAFPIIFRLRATSRRTIISAVWPAGARSIILVSLKRSDAAVANSVLRAAFGFDRKISCTEHAIRAGSAMNDQTAAETEEGEAISTQPRLALAVGVVGHRPGDRLRAEATAKVAAQVAAILTAFERAVQAALTKHAAGFAAEKPPLALVSALAEGADRIAAEAALAAGSTLDVVLPFSAGEYKKDFKDQQSKDRFDALCDRARAELVLPGTRKNADDPDDPDAKKAYEAAGFTVLSQSDIVLAIWDGGPSKGRGGTTEMVNTAARFGLPITRVDAGGKAPPLIRWNGLRAAPASG